MVKGSWPSRARSINSIKTNGPIKLHENKVQLRKYCLGQMRFSQKCIADNANGKQII